MTTCNWLSGYFTNYQLYLSSTGFVWLILWFLCSIVYFHLSVNNLDLRNSISDWWVSGGLDWTILRSWLYFLMISNNSVYLASYFYFQCYSCYCIGSFTLYVRNLSLNYSICSFILRLDSSIIYSICLLLWSSCCWCWDYGFLEDEIDCWIIVGIDYWTMASIYCRNLAFIYSNS